jgi:hypothetical protein
MAEAAKLQSHVAKDIEANWADEVSRVHGPTGWSCGRSAHGPDIDSIKAIKTNKFNKRLEYRNKDLLIEETIVKA